MNFEFEISINDKFVNINENGELKPIDKKHVLGFMNDYENGKWRDTKFQEYIFNSIAETALSQKERSSLVGKPHSILARSVGNIRRVNDDGKGSELCEILLYGIMKDHYGALPVVPKIFYKQNPQDYAKGADSVHIVVIDDGKDFTLWFGEAKFYTKISGAIDSAIASVEKFFSDKGMQIKKENSIVTSSSDIDQLGLDERLIAKIKETLDQNISLDNIRPKINVPILLLYECNITKESTEFTLEYKAKIIEHHKDSANKYFKKQINKLHGAISQYEKITFHLILFPVPNKDDVVEEFCKRVNNYHE